MPGGRAATIRRKTKETEIEIRLDLDFPDPDSPVETGVPFFDHMLDTLRVHGRFGLAVRASGDLEVDAHHLVEDVGIALGSALREALGAELRITRFGQGYAPLDDSLARCVVDIGGRAFLHYEAAVSHPAVGTFETHLVEDFLRAFVGNARLNLHVDLIRGGNAHHEIEAIFKAMALALRTAVQRETGPGGIPSTKGSL